MTAGPGETGEEPATGHRRDGGLIAQQSPMLAAPRSTNRDVTNALEDDFIERRSTIVVLRDRTRILLRPVVPEDKERFTQAFAKLSPRSRYRRFMAPIAELTPDMLTRLTEVDHVDHFAWVAILADQPGQPGVGGARYVRIPGEPEVAEAAVTVIDEYQGRGIGTLLLEALGAIALENGIRRFRAYASGENLPLLELLRNQGVPFRHDSPGLIVAEVHLPERAEDLKRTPVYRLLQALARGQPE